MYTFTSILLFAIAAELLRRCCMVLITAFTGPLSKIPGPVLWKLTPLPWVYENITGNVLNVNPKLFEKYGDVVRVAPKEVLFASKSAILKILVDDDLKKAPVYESVRQDHHVTSLISETDKTAYKHRRRILSPGFSISYLNGLEPLVQDCIDVLVRVITAKCAAADGKAVIDVDKMLGNLTSDIMAATSFGGSNNLVESDDAALKGMFMKRLVRVALEAQFPLIKWLPAWLNLPFVPESNVEEICGVIDGIVEERRKIMREGGKPKRDLVQIFIDNNEADPVGFSDLHIREEMVLFMIAGSDTTSMTEVFTLLLLLNNPSTLATLLKEINTTFPSINDPITFAKTQDLPYLNAVINESMRVLPIVGGGLARVTEEPTMLSGYQIPAGIIVAACLSAMQVSPLHWPDGAKFVPERWIAPYKGVEADRKAFMPFSAGSRNCPGQQFALKNLRITLATLLRRFEVSLVEGQSHELRVHTVPWFKQGGYWVGFKVRED